MIITVNDLLDSGLPLSEEISERKIENAIFTAEQFIIKNRLGDQQYIAIITSPAEYETILDGGAYVDHKGKNVWLAGLCEAETHLAYALILRDNITATIFGSVLKKDDYSDQAGEDRLNAVARYHTEVGLAYLKEITDALGIDNTDRALNDWYEELV